MKRRDFFKASIVVSAALTVSSSFTGITTQTVDGRKISKVAFPEK